MKPYGKELILDMHECDHTAFTRDHIDEFFHELCYKIDMVQCDRFWWDDQDTPEEEKQTSPVQFIITSNITIHTLAIMKRVYLNIFSCKDFEVEVVRKVALEYFGGMIVAEHTRQRI